MKPCGPLFFQGLQTPLLVLLAASLAMAAGDALAQASTSTSTSTITQPTQQTSGPGSNVYLHAGARMSNGGVAQDAFDVFEPTDPKPAKAPVVVILHGYYVTLNDQMRYFIEHTVRKGNIVIFPKYQTAPWTPCIAAINIDACVKSTANGIHGALALLRSDPTRVQPETDKTTYFGYSFGGILAANVANRWQALGVPKPRILYLDEPHDGALTGPGEPGLDKNLSGIPADALVQCYNGSAGVTVTKPGSSCNALFPRLSHIPDSNKDLVMLYSDDHGTPALVADHYGLSISTSFGKLTAYDYFHLWKVMDALRSCAFEGRDCEYALGDTPEHRFNGIWSDGTPIKPLKVQDAAPIAP